MSEDTIYRQDALNEIQRFLGYLDQDMINRIKIGIGRLPSAQPNSSGLSGWICPVCGRGLSPYISVCPCKNGLKGWEITC